MKDTPAQIGFEEIKLELAYQRYPAFAGRYTEPPERESFEVLRAVVTDPRFHISGKGEICLSLPHLTEKEMEMLEEEAESDYHNAKVSQEAGEKDL